MDLFKVLICDRHNENGWTEIAQGCRFGNGWFAFAYNSAIARPYLYEDLEQLTKAHLNNPCLKIEWQMQ